jgi:integrase
MRAGEVAVLTLDDIDWRSGEMLIHAKGRQRARMPMPSEAGAAVVAYRRDHLRALAQRVGVADGEVRIMGSKGDLLRTLAAASGVKSAAGGVRSSVLKWRATPDDDEHYVYAIAL